MPPLPSRETIAYGPIWVPEDRGMRGASISLGLADHEDNLCQKHLFVAHWIFTTEHRFCRAKVNPSPQRILAHLAHGARSTRRPVIRDVDDQLE